MSNGGGDRNSGHKSSMPMLLWAAVIARAILVGGGTGWILWRVCS
jgi:hypothetical protein